MEDLAFDGAALHDAALGGVELVEPGCEQRAERRRHLDLVLAVACHRQHLGDEERVASGRPLDPRSEPRRDAVSEQRADLAAGSLGRAPSCLITSTTGQYVISSP